MRLLQDVLTTNLSFDFFTKMRGSVLPVSLLSILSLSATASSYHSNVGVLKFVNPFIGTEGVTPNGNGMECCTIRSSSPKTLTDPSIFPTLGGMIPSVSPPFGMTRWTPQTRENFISQCPYNYADQHIHGFQATHQPAIWMGESGQVVLSPGVGQVTPLFTQRAHRFSKKDEVSTPYVYSVTMDATAIEADYNLTESIFSPVPGGAQPVPAIVSEGANGRTRRAVPVKAEATRLPVARRRRRNAGTISVDMTATSHVGFMQVDFTDSDDAPNFVVQATRQNWTGTLSIDAANREISGSNPQRQDYDLGPFHASGFRGYFVSRFSEPFASYGVVHGGDIQEKVASGEGEHLSGYVTFRKDVRKIEVRTGVSFVSVEQARKNLDTEAPDSTTFSDAVENLKKAWLEKLGRVTIEGHNQTDAEHDPRTIFYTAAFHALQYPNVRVLMRRWFTPNLWSCYVLSQRALVKPNWR